MQHLNSRQKYGAILVFAFFILIALLSFFSLPVTINPPEFLPVFSALFIYFTSIAVAYLAALSYLKGSSRMVLLLATGVLVAGSTAVIGELFFLLSVDPFLIGVIVSIGSLLGSLIHFVNLILTSFTTRHFKEHAKKAKILISYSGVILLTLFLTVISLRGETLNIPVPGSVLSILPSTAELGVVIFCGITGIFFLRLFVKEQSLILFWYSLGLLLIALSHFSTLLQVYPNDLIAWAGRIAGYIADVYLVGAVVVAFRTRSEKEILDV